jgi:RTX calcium-binding nonapeptide repeat (4 copies)
MQPDAHLQGLPVGAVFTTNDVPGCPKGGLLSGTDNHDRLGGKDGDDEIHGLGGSDEMDGGPGDDAIYGVPGGDYLVDGFGEVVLYGGKGNDALEGVDELGPPMRDELYCGPGKDVWKRRKPAPSSSSGAIPRRSSSIACSLALSSTSGMGEMSSRRICPTHGSAAL